MTWFWLIMSVLAAFSTSYRRPSGYNLGCSFMAVGFAVVSYLFSAGVV